MPTLQNQDPQALQLLQGGQALFPALVQAIDAGTAWVQLETYIFDVHGQGADVAEALVRAARRGVLVQVLVDGVGTDRISPEWHEKFDQAGVQWRFYAPLGRGRFAALGLLVPERWRRLHRKLCVVDEHIVFCGGINILDDFYDPNHGPLTEPRFDFAVALIGPLAVEASDAMALLWWRVEAGYSARQRHLLAAWEAVKAAGYGGRSAGLGHGASFRPTRGRSDTAGLLLRDNLLNRRTIERAYRKAIGKAHDEIIIANAYFVPGGKLRRALIRASRRGVKVSLLLQGRYEYFMQYHAARPVYGALLAAGVEIHEYDAGFLHAKVAVIDGRWATVGSSNLDPLSLLLAREANVVVQDPGFAQALRERLVLAMTASGVRLDPDIYSRRPWRQRALDYIAYALMRLALLIAGQRY
ncbi:MULTISPECIES: cardiolipin synthase ClsB [unclassified Polaromonas]|jgi:cardiolipin synthase|uniref:cardiolipin synthase ClsB n=1 Tax=unclassified Polaromonas TaxID=2638319 RepID=UPI000BCA704D|nr:MULTISPECIES: cardiolipin synthase ClsB [unclassified Polaromonas]OYY35965.1 MAG: cardiolipin synthase B [Polaromonas sp. 35-63-35]OYZ19731.1 MAG: cardiolipin synthase B [Polaromonas sp. 16-63-31]OYZ80003.1 MAG: cardiolipin synthase B [Polaromonas sp. 24-63-21]OZA52120.1 MAG: cardiolipin synthase B [Polaromonas sp. 17-63-33]OZA87848.1 MAG: cardiolipin synthase B [Polaromonas sp. 39-63-25]